MARTRKPQKIPTPGSRPMPNPVQEIPVIAGESSARPQPRQKKFKVQDTPGERGIRGNSGSKMGLLRKIIKKTTSHYKYAMSH